MDLNDEAGNSGGAGAGGPRAPDGRLRLPWFDPDERTWAVAIPRRGANGSHRDARDRRGRLKVDKVDLVRASPPGRDASPAAQTDASGLNPAQERWLLDATTRRWAAITSTFGPESHAIARGLVEAGVVELRVPVNDAALDLEHPYSWRLTETWTALASRIRQSRSDRRTRVAEEAHAAASLTASLDPELARALRSAPDHWPLLPVLIAAARDLAAGIRHDGPRAFSQAHFNDSKIRENAPDILREAGASEDTIDLLGLRRSPYIGLGGPITVAGLNASDVPGPVRFRADPHRPLAISIQPAATQLLLVENLQAAEAACDTHLGIATAWFAGQPADAVLDSCMILARQAGRRRVRVLVAPDADLGGAHIATRLLKAIPPNLDLEIVDVGGVPHPPGPHFSAQALAHLDRLQRQAAQDASCPYSPKLSEYLATMIRRGYAVEQEATIRAALEPFLRDDRD